MTDSYIHGFSDEEQARLSRMQALLNEAELAQIDLTGVRTVVDVGSGLGQLSRAFARAIGPDGHVVAVEPSARQREEAQRQAAMAEEADRVDFRTGTGEALPLSPTERGTFDLVHARFVLEHVQDPQAVVTEMTQATRPGGRVVLVDDDHELLTLYPECVPVAAVWRAYWESYRDRGHDPLVGRRLPELLHRAGVQRIEVKTIFYGAVQGDAQFELAVDNLRDVLRGAASALQMHRVAPSQMTDALDALDAWKRRDAATIWYSLPMAVGYT